MDARVRRFGAALAVDGVDVLRFVLLAARTPAADGGGVRALRRGNAAAGLLGWVAAAAVLVGLLEPRSTVRGRARRLLLLGAALTDGGAAAVALAARARSDPRSRRVVAESAHLLLGGSAITAVYLRVLGGGPPVEAPSPDPPRPVGSLFPSSS